jgi:hypothetical protein
MAEEGAESEAVMSSLEQESRPTELPQQSSSSSPSVSVGKSKRALASTSPAGDRHLVDKMRDNTGKKRQPSGDPLLVTLDVIVPMGKWKMEGPV